MTRTFTLAHTSFFAVTLALGLAACGSKDNQGVSTQVVAKVGAEEISVHQINQVLRHAGTANASVSAMGREVLEKLIDQQLAINEATESKLNRSPQVIAEIEAARREVLAKAYMQQITGSLTKPTPEEVKSYYVKHPELFAERRIFNLQEIIVPTTPNLAQQLRSLAAGGKTTEEVSAWLKGKDIAFSSGSASRTAEQIPLEMLATIHPLKDGQSAVLEATQAITFLRINSSQQAPITEAEALPSIEKFLSNQRTGEAMKAKLKELRANTKITYMGEFAKAESASRTPSTDNSNNIEKGVAGLK